MTDRTNDRWEAAQEGAELLREGEPDAAIEELERVIAQDDQNEYAFYFLGAANFERGHFEKAMAAYVRALTIAPGYLGAMVHLGHSLRMLGKHGEALRMGREALNRSPEDADALYLVALCHYARGEAAAAKTHLERFLATRPELEAAQEAEGLLRVLRGDVERVESEEPRPSSSPPSSPRGWNLN